MSKPTPPKSSAKTTTTRPTGPVTIEMVAQLAGVSASTISRILNGTAVVSEVKQQAVKDAIAKLGYVPNPVARGLAGGRTYSIGVITQTIDSPFYGTSLRGIEEELDPVGYNPLFVSAHWDAATEARCIDVLRSRRVDRAPDGPGPEGLRQAPAGGGHRPHAEGARPVLLGFR